jgi:hypothetical protein
MSSLAKSGGRHEAEECDGCRLPFLDFQTDFVNHAGDRLCIWCRTVFWAATVLFEPEVGEEDVVIPTLAFAKYSAGIPEYNKLVAGEGGGGKPTPADLARVLLGAAMISPGELERGYLGWDFVREVQGVPLIRVLPFTVFAEEHRGKQLLKQIRIQVLSKYAEPKDVRGCYERLLAERGVKWDDSASGCVSHNVWGSYLDVRIRPTDELIYKDVALDRELIERHKDYFIRKAYPESYPSERLDDYPYPYPSPRYIEASYKALRGLLRSTKPVGIAGALDLYGKPSNRTLDKLIPAFVAWHLGADVAPATRRPEIARTLNKHLLGPCDKETLPEDSWRSDDTVWRDAKELSKRFERLRGAGFDKALDKPIF